jgi:hypothetical protein
MIAGTVSGKICKGQNGIANAVETHTNCGEIKTFGGR